MILEIMKQHRFGDKGVVMKKKIGFFLGILFFAGTGAQTIGFAAEPVPTVCLNEKKEFTYYADEDEKVPVDGLSLNAFTDMAPGDERTQTIHLHNGSKDKVRFYISQKTLDTLEDDNEASGGAYKFNLLVGEGEDAVSLLDTETGGYDASGKGSRDGLAEMDELKDYTFLAETDAGDGTNLYLTLKLEGEGNDNRSGNDYTDAVAQLALNFRAYDVDHPLAKDKEIVEHKKRIINIKKTKLVKTGDSIEYGIFTVVFIAGVTFVVAAVRKQRKGGQENEENR